jgi:hypothetical protein
MTNSNQVQALAERLYRAMPGAPMPPMEDGFYMWGDVEGNDHWAFCEEIAAAILNAQRAAIKHADQGISYLSADHNLI